MLLVNKKKERQQIIHQYLKTNQISEQSEILNMLIANNYTIDQSTVSRDLKELGYIKGSNNIYEQTKTRIMEDQKDLLAKIIYNCQPSVWGPAKSIHMVIIRVGIGYEQAVADLLHSIYENKIMGTIAGKNCVVLLTGNEKRAIRISKEIRRWRVNGKVGKNSVRVQEEIEQGD